MLALIGHETLLQRTKHFLTQGVSAIINRIIINHGLMNNFQNCLFERSRLIYSGCRTQVITEENLSHVRRFGRRHFKSKKREPLKNKINDILNTYYQQLTHWFY
jgi:ABC-type cobalamin transport system ATPase subunit